MSEEERDSTTAGEYPLLRRVTWKPKYATERVRFAIGGEAIEGFELWLPEPAPVFEQSLVELETRVSIDGALVDLDYLVARFRWNPHRDVYGRRIRR